MSVGAAGVSAQIDGPPSSAANAAGPTLATPVLSLRRALDQLAAATADRSLTAGLDQFVATQPPDTCLRVDVGRVRYDHRGDDPQSPASLQKLLVGVAALTELGPDHVFVTHALTKPPIDGVVAGDLYLRGSGDPVLSTAAYAARERNQPQVFTDVERLADGIVAAGITAIAGSVVGDEHRYDTVRYNPVWPLRFLRQSQVGPLSALSVNDGFAYFPENGNAVFGAAPEPAAYAATVLDAALRARGVEVGDVPRAGATPLDVSVVAGVGSPALADIVAGMLRESDNNTAELLLKELGLRRGGEGSFAAGQAAITQILAEAGLGMDEVTVADGSGLAAEDLVSCDFVIELLEHGPTAEMVHDSLPVAGESGTLARRWRDTDLAGRIRAKTGTLNQVTALAGSADATDGRATFALIVNLAPPAVIQAETVAAHETLARLLTTYPNLPDLEHLRPRAVEDG